MSNTDNDKLDWMYKGATSNVDREEYLLGKSVDKTFEQLNNEDKEKKLGLVPPKNHVEHECIPPSIRDYNKIVQQEQVDLSAKLQEDPLVAIKKQEEEARRQFLQNPIQLKKLQEAMQAQETKKKKKKKRKQHKQSDSEDDLDRQLSEKLRNLKGSSVNFPKKDKKKNNNVGHLDVILMHKFNQLKDKLSQKDLDDIMAGKSSDSDDEIPETKKQKRQRSSSNASSDDSGAIRKNVKPEKRKYSSYKEKKERRKHRDSSNDSFSGHNAERKNKKEVEKEKHKNDHKSRPSSSSNRYRDKLKNNRRRKSSSSSSGERRKQSYKETLISQSNKDEDLDKMILQKLRMLRDSKIDKPEETSVNKANNLTEYSYDSDKDEYVLKKKSFGLVRSDGTKIPLNNPTLKPKQQLKKPEPKQAEAKKTNKRLSEKEKDELRKQMMCDAVERDKERSDNLKRHRQENRREENVEDFDKNFVHRELSKSQRNIKDVETRIKSKLNNIQRSTRHMDSNFSKRS